MGARSSPPFGDRHGTRSAIRPSAHRIYLRFPEDGLKPTSDRQDRSVARVTHVAISQRYYMYIHTHGKRVSVTRAACKKNVWYPVKVTYKQDSKNRGWSGWIHNQYRTRGKYTFLSFRQIALRITHRKKNDKLMGNSDPS